MKLELIHSSAAGGYTCYRAKLKDSIWKIYIPSRELVHREVYNKPTIKLPTEKMVAYTARIPLDGSEHVCHKCFKTYPKHQYQKHAKRYHK